MTGHRRFEVRLDLMDAVLQFIQAHPLACAMLAISGSTAFIRGLIKGLRESLSGPVQGPDTQSDDGWVYEPLEGSAGKRWERSTGCTVERRRSD